MPSFKIGCNIFIHQKNRKNVKGTPNRLKIYKTNTCEAFKVTTSLMTSCQKTGEKEIILCLECSYLYEATKHIFFFL